MSRNCPEALSEAYHLILKCGPVGYSRIVSFVFIDEVTAEEILQCKWLLRFS